MFLIRPVDTHIAKAEAEYVINTLKAKKIGLECVDNATGVNGCNAAKKVIDANKKKGVSVFVERTNSTTATDLTEQARAMNGADAVLDFNFPNPLGVMSNAARRQRRQRAARRRCERRHPGSAGAVTGAAATNLKGVDDCVPDRPDRQAVKKWVADYTAKFAGETPDLLVGAGLRHAPLRGGDRGEAGCGDAEGGHQGPRDPVVRGHLRRLQGRRHPGAVAHRRHREVRRQRRRDHREGAHLRSRRAALHGGDQIPTTTVAPTTTTKAP